MDLPVEKILPTESYAVGFRYTPKQLPGSALISSSEVTATRVRRADAEDDENVSTAFLGGDPAAATVSADGLSATVKFSKDVALVGDWIRLDFQHVLDNASADEFTDCLLLKVVECKVRR